MKYYLLKISFFALILLVDSCIQPFSPPEVNSPYSYLVVDGFLNVGRDTSRITLRRTQNTNDFTNPVVESGAKLTVESETGGQYFFSEENNGQYVLLPDQFSDSDQYRLRIITSGGQEYLSEYVGVSKTPPIDSIGYKVDLGREAAVFYVNTHDPQNNTRFYRWKFEETWEYRAAHYSGLEVVNEEVVPRRDNINICWQKSLSTNILLGSTVKLSSDIIKDLPLNIVAISTNKLYFKYSILIKQYGLSQQAFEYWTDLAKTTQGTGTLFDPQPSQITGNIRSTTNLDDLVFGYFSASTETQKRIVIAPGVGSYPRCMDPDTIPIKCSDQVSECGLKTSQLLLQTYGRRSDSVFVVAPSCADCRLQGGTTTRPPYM
ncbi:DUF4249 domain-containing protein [Dyadobacter sp. NIV53]|uniref:DUF4249 domain-containing protein n=1 Tax=Dyadobacter sp. NIV53 TaxID=2861765 RepID=UPI001C867736|nr:DUF4249 domain-containing protein [Dyadobacter sp. NIV53]